MHCIWKIQNFGATLMFDPHFFVFNGIIQTILVAFSMKTSRACTGMLFSENDDFKVLKTAKNIKKYVHHVYYSYRARVTVLSLQTSIRLTRNINVKVAIELYYIYFPKFRYW